MSDTTRHERYTWVVRTVLVENAQDVLNELSNGDFEVFSTHIADIPLGLEGHRPRMVIAARQSENVSRRTNKEKADADHRVLTAQGRFKISGTAPEDGVYSSSCQHVQHQHFVGGALLSCHKCGFAQITWALIEPVSSS